MSCCRSWRTTLTFGLESLWRTKPFDFPLPEFNDPFLHLRLSFFTESWDWSGQFTRPPPATATSGGKSSPGKNPNLWCSDPHSCDVMNQSGDIFEDRSMFFTTVLTKLKWENYIKTIYFVIFEPDCGKTCSKNGLKLWNLCGCLVRIPGWLSKSSKYFNFYHNYKGKSERSIPEQLSQFTLKHLGLLKC